MQIIFEYNLICLIRVSEGRIKFNKTRRGPGFYQFRITQLRGLTLSLNAMQCTVVKQRKGVGWNLKKSVPVMVLEIKKYLQETMWALNLMPWTQ